MLRTRGWLLLALLALCLALVLIYHHSPAKPPPFQVFRQPGPAPASFRDRLGRWLPTSPAWAWVWRLENGVFGRRQPVNLNAEILALADSSPATLTSLALGTANFSDPTGLQVWVLDSAHLDALRDRLKNTAGADPLSHPRISTADGIGCSLFQGQTILLAGRPNQVGLDMNCFARLYTDRTDLIASIRLSEVLTNSSPISGGPSPSPAVFIQTNLDTSFRLQVPKARGLFLLQTNPAPSDRKPIGILLAPPQPKT